MRFLIAGSSGFLGTRLREALTARGHQVTSLVRRPPQHGEIQWDPYVAPLGVEVVENHDVVVNLAGSPTLGNPHSNKWAESLMTSRVVTTGVLAEAIAAVPDNSKPAFLAGNGIGIYGDHGGEPLTESADSRGDALLTRVSRAWQAAAEPAVAAGARVCVLRTAPVYDRRSQPLGMLRLLFKAGLGGPLGDGSQYVPMISTRDWVAAVIHLAEAETAEGPFNLCCATAPTNQEFTRELAQQLHRPAFLRVPEFVLRPAAGTQLTEPLTAPTRQLPPTSRNSTVLVTGAVLGSAASFPDPSTVPPAARSNTLSRRVCGSWCSNFTANTCVTSSSTTSPRAAYARRRVKSACPAREPRT